MDELLAMSVARDNCTPTGPLRIGAGCLALGKGQRIHQSRRWVPAISRAHECQNHQNDNHEQPADHCDRHGNNKPSQETQARRFRLLFIRCRAGLRHD